MPMAPSAEIFNPSQSPMFPRFPEAEGNVYPVLANYDQGETMPQMEYDAGLLRIHGYLTVFADMTLEGLENTPEGFGLPFEMVRDFIVPAGVRTVGMDKLMPALGAFPHCFIVHAVHVRPDIGNGRVAVGHAGRVTRVCAEKAAWKNRLCTVAIYGFALKCQELPHIFDNLVVVYCKEYPFPVMICCCLVIFLQRVF